MKRFSNSHYSVLNRISSIRSITEILKELPQKNNEVMSWREVSELSELGGISKLADEYSIETHQYFVINVPRFGPLNEDGDNFTFNGWRYYYESFPKEGICFGWRKKLIKEVTNYEQV